MNIQLDKQANGTAYATVTVEPADYEEAVVKELKNLRRNITLPGFRPGNVPQSIINKKYRKSVLADELNKISYKSVEDYVKNEGIETIGNIIPSEKQGTIDLDSATTFEFVFEFGLAPEISLSLNKKNRIEKPVIVPDDEMFGKYMDSFLARYSEMKDFDAVEAGDTLRVNLDNGDMKIEDASLMLRDLDEETAKTFVGKKAGEKMQVEITKVYPKEKQRAAVLSVKEEELAGIKPEFELEIVKSQRLVKPEINDQFFETAFPEKDVTTEEQMNAKKREDLAKELNSQIQWGFWNDVISYVKEKADISLPDDFMKRWLLVINEGKFTEKEIEEEYPKFAESMKWELIRKKILSDAGVKMDRDFVKEEAKLAAKEMFMTYGMGNTPDEYLESYAERMLQDQEQAENVFNRAADRKAITLVLDMVTVKEKEMTVDEYSDSVKKKTAKETKKSE